MKKLRILCGSAMRSVFALCAAAGLAAGCASRSSEITASYVSPLPYEPLNCQQLAGEAERLSARAAQTAGVQDQKRSDDAVTTTVSVIIFWPALFALKGDGNTAAELARLKGEMEAIERCPSASLVE